MNEDKEQNTTFVEDEVDAGKNSSANQSMGKNESRWDNETEWAANDTMDDYDNYKAQYYIYDPDTQEYKPYLYYYDPYDEDADHSLQNDNSSWQGTYITNNYFYDNSYTLYDYTANGYETFNNPYEYDYSPYEFYE